MFFKQIENLIGEGAVMHLSIMKKAGKLTVTVSQRQTDAKINTDEKLESLKPLSLVDTAEEMDKQFFGIITEPVQMINTLVTNLEAVKESIKEAAKPAKKKASVSKQPMDKDDTALPESEDDDDTDEVLDANNNILKENITKPEKPKTEKQIAKELTEQGDKFFTDKDYTSAREVFQKLVALYPTDKKLATKLKSAEQWEKAMSNANVFQVELPKIEFVEPKPESAIVQAGKDEFARQSMKEVIEEKPSFDAEPIKEDNDFDFQIPTLE